LTALGHPCSGKDLLLAGERIVNLERLFNVRHGFGRKDDQLPSRFSREPLDIFTFTLNPETGKMDPSVEPIHTGIIHDFQAMLDRYYSLRGWNDNGIPTIATLTRLGLSDEKYKVRP